MKAVHIRARNGARTLFTLSRTAVPEHRVTETIVSAFNETAHSLLSSGDVRLPNEEPKENENVDTVTASVEISIVVAEYRRV